MMKLANQGALVARQQAPTDAGGFHPRRLHKGLTSVRLSRAGSCLRTRQRGSVMALLLLREIEHIGSAMGINFCYDVLLGEIEHLDPSGKSEPE